MAGGPPELLYQGQSGELGIDDIAVDDERVFFSELGALLSVPKDGGRAEVIAWLDLESYGVVADDLDVYWLDHAGTAYVTEPFGFLFKAPKIGGDPILMTAASDDGPSPRDLVVDDRCVYWSELSADRLMKIAK